jgi:hypothetical protein
MENEAKLIVLGIIIATSFLTVSWTIDFAFAENKNFQFEISDCSIQRNSTYEKSGPCPDLGTERTVDNSKVEPQTKVDSVSETDKAEPQTKVDSVSETDKAEPQTKVDSVSETDKAEPQTKVDSVSETDKAEPQTKVDSVPDNQIEGSVIDSQDKFDKIKKYNFDELHISGADEELENNSETKPVQSTLPTISGAVDPFGPSMG